MAFNILIVDDSPTIRAIITKVLRLAKVAINELYEAENGQEALDILKDNWIDLVLADINMPVMNGIEMIERMSADGLLDTIPVIVVSTEGSTPRVERLKNQGIKGYIRKPCSPEFLRQLVDETLGVA